jgi:putative hydrolase of the HAD superfamily
MKKKLRMISVDCWGTILVDRPAWSQEIYAFISSELMKHPDHVDERAFRSACEIENNVFVASLDRDHITPHNSRRIQRIAQSLGLTLSEAELFRIAAGVDGVVSSLPPQARHGASEFLRDVHRRGLRISVVSNTGWLSGDAVRTTLQNQNLGVAIDCMFFSDTVGCAKPCRRIFEVALAACGCNSADCVHIGDTFSTDIKGAVGMGIYAIYLCPLEGSPNDESPCFTDFESIATHLDRTFEFESCT